ncbi:MAG: alpha/beta hydrolase [Actinomycetota bacterium]|nr:alpha/beta hydrolase [Actinomycetota bacterium]
MGKMLAMVATAGGALTGALWLSTARADAAAVRADPVAPSLTDPDVPGEQRWVSSADGTRLNVQLHGPKDAPAVVFSHGWTCSTRYWNPQVRALGADYRVITYDQRGHGASANNRGKYGPDVLADDLSAVLDATLEPGQRAVLVGHSMGAMSIVAWAGRYPDEVAGRAGAALLASTGVDGLLAESLVVRLPTRWPRGVEVVGRSALGMPTPLGRPSPLAYRGVKYVALSPKASPAQVAFCEEIVLGCRARARGKWGSALSRLDLRDSLTHLRVPTTVLVGSADRLTPPGHARRLAEALEHDGHLDELIELPGVGHMSTVEDAPRVNAEIRRLLDRK